MHASLSICWHTLFYTFLCLKFHSCVVIKLPTIVMWLHREVKGSDMTKNGSHRIRIFHFSTGVDATLFWCTLTALKINTACCSAAIRLHGSIRFQRKRFFREMSKSFLSKTFSRAFSGVSFQRVKWKLIKSGGGGYLVERWVRGCAVQMECLFGLSGLPMAPFCFWKLV